MADRTWIRDKDYTVETINGVEYVGYFYPQNEMDDGTFDDDVDLLKNLGIKCRLIAEPDGGTILVPYDRITEDGDWE